MLPKASLFNASTEKEIKQMMLWFLILFSVPIIMLILTLKAAKYIIGPAGIKGSQAVFTEPQRKDQHVLRQAQAEHPHEESWYRIHPSEGTQKWKNGVTEATPHSGNTQFP